MDNRPLGFFDSGVGGVSVLTALSRRLPGEDVIYFGDTAHVPYGNKRAEDLLAYGQGILDFMLRQEVKAVVVACNTASSMVLGELKDRYASLPMIGMVRSGARAAVKATKNHRIGVIATENVVQSAAYTSYIQNEDCTYQVFEQACPTLVPLIEAGIVRGGQVRQDVTRYVTPLLEQKIDTLVLGCTHYLFMDEVIREVAGGEINLVDPAEETIEEMARVLKKKELLRTDATPGTYRFYVSGDAGAFRRTAAVLFPEWARQVFQVSWEKGQLVL